MKTKTTKYLSILALAAIEALYSTTPALAASFLETAQNSAVQDFPMLTTAGASAIISGPNDHDRVIISVYGSNSGGDQSFTEPATLGLLALGFGLVVLGYSLRRCGCNEQSSPPS